MNNYLARKATYLTILCAVTLSAPLQVLAQNFRLKIDDPTNFDADEGGTDLVVELLEVLILIMVPIITIMIIYAGFMYVSARGNAEQVNKATRALTYAIIGAILVLGSVVLANLVRDAVCQSNPSSGYCNS